MDDDLRMHRLARRVGHLEKRVQELERRLEVQSAVPGTAPTPEAPPDLAAAALPPLAGPPPVPLAAAAITVNAEANGVAVRAICADVLDADAPPAPGPDLVLVADAFYEKDLAGQVLRFMERSRARGAAVLAGDFGRTYLPRACLAPLASYDVPGLLAMEGSETKRTTVWTLR